jgi:acyl-CoA reductase-like NAD-dependent aldehyde dehydrogenase
MNSYAMVSNGRSLNTKEQDPVINPAFGEPFATCARATSADVQEAMEAAGAAFKTWRKDEAFRRRKLHECAAAIQSKVQDIATVLSRCRDQREEVVDPESLVRGEPAGVWRVLSSPGRG